MRWLTDRGRAPVQVRDHLVPVAGGEILVRIYRPTGLKSSPLPAYLYLHGGSLWLGSVADYDPICRRGVGWTEAALRTAYGRAE